MRRAIIANADADLLCALAECACNILIKNIPLTELQTRRVSKYRTKLRLRDERPPPGEDTSYCNSSLARVSAEAFYRPSEHGWQVRSYYPCSDTCCSRSSAMEHDRKMALVDPRLLGTLRSPPPPTPLMVTLGKKVQALDDEMMTILAR